MGRLKNIAKTWQRLALPSGGWGVLLLTAFLLLAGMRYASAQNTAGGPYINSWHQYAVQKSATSNISEWVIFNTLSDANSNIGGTTLNAQSWVNLTSPVASEARVAIYFDNTVFAPTTRYLVYSEYPSSGSNICVARRSFLIDIKANTFYEDLPVADNGNTCNSSAGKVWDNDVDNLSLISDVTTVTFTVYMHKADANFHIDNWQFDATVNVTNAALHTSVFPVSSASSDQGTWTIDDGVTLNEGIFHMTVVTPDNVDFIQDRLTFSVNVYGVITDDYTVELEIENGVANSGSTSTYVVVTADNESGNRTVSRTIFGIPNTSLVSVTP
jgi:hypothetical protein